jgi:Flp pilus assembly protein TadG
MPVIVLVMLGSIDFGRFLNNSIAVTNAARAGAGIGIVSRYPDPDPATSSALANWQMSICVAVAHELGMNTDFSAAGSSDPDGYTNSQGLYVNASRRGEPGGLWQLTVTARYPFAWWTFPSDAQPQQTVVYRSIR